MRAQEIPVLVWVRRNAPVFLFEPDRVVQVTKEAGQHGRHGLLDDTGRQTVLRSYLDGRVLEISPNLPCIWS